MHYDVARIMSGVVLSEDSGLYIRDACKAIYYYGVCQETAWPYDESKLSVYPTLAALKSNNTFKTFAYVFVNQDATSLRQCLNTYQRPIIFGMMVYPSFMSTQVAKTGMVPMPGNKETPQGGHCVLMVGYDDARSLFICANSWGTGWGDAGYFYLPYAYAANTKYASDFCYLTITP
jgi:C1A family cysteine protease